jgi:hypothetical protein
VEEIEVCINDYPADVKISKDQCIEGGWSFCSKPFVQAVVK